MLSYGRFVRSSILGAMMACGAASAQVAGTMDVTLELVDGCIVTGSPDSLSNVDFGTVDFGVAPTLFASNLEAQAVLGGTPTQLMCSLGAALNIAVGGGLHETGGARRMASGSNYVEYQLRTAPGGGGDPYALDTPHDLSHLASGTPFDLPIYGVVSPQSGLTPGNYADTVTITLTF